MPPNMPPNSMNVGKTESILRNKEYAERLAKAVLFAI